MKFLSQKEVSASLPKHIASKWLLQNVGPRFSEKLAAKAWYGKHTQPLTMARVKAAKDKEICILIDQLPPASKANRKDNIFSVSIEKVEKDINGTNIHFRLGKQGAKIFGKKKLELTYEPSMGQVVFGTGSDPVFVFVK